MLQTLNIFFFFSLSKDFHILNNANVCDTPPSLRLINNDSVLTETEFAETQKEEDYERERERDTKK